MRTVVALFAVLVLLPSLALADGGRLVDNPAKDSPEWVIQKTLEAGVADDFNGWYTTHCHPDYCLNTPVNIKEFQKYRWKQFLKWAPSYVKDSGKKSFEITSTSPAQFDAASTEVKFFLKSSQRDNPVPIILKKDGKGAWKVFNMSL